MTTPNERPPDELSDDEARRFHETAGKCPVKFLPHTTPNEPLSDSEIAAFRELARSLPGETWEWEYSNGEPYNLQIPSELLHEYEGFKSYGHPMVQLKTVKGWAPRENVAKFIVLARNIADRIAAEWQEKTEMIRELVDQLSSATTIMNEAQRQLTAANARIAELVNDRERILKLNEELEIGLDRMCVEKNKVAAERDALAKRLAEAEAEVERLRSEVRTMTT